MYFEKQRDNFSITTDPDRLDVDAVHAYLTRSYWAEGIPKEIVSRSVQHSLCFGLFETGRQIGLARVITDRATFAYLCDLYVLEEYRGRGLGKWLMESVLEHPDLQNLRRFLLATRDAQGLYGRYGFRTLQNPDRHMEIRHPDVYKR
jgi:ribosomal protein S18 acetylase RimI-like enzyme